MAVPLPPAFTGFSWDETKRQANIIERNIDFALVEDFDFRTAIIAIDDRFDYGEVREIAIVYIDERLHVLIFTRRASVIHVISLRKTKAYERRIDAKERSMVKQPKKPDHVSQDDWDAIHSPEIDDELFVKMRPVPEIAPELIEIQEHIIARRGRPRAEATKKLQSLRLSPRVIEYFKASGAKWQTRINEALEDFVDRKQRSSAKAAPERTKAAKTRPKKVPVKKLTVKKTAAKRA